MRHQAVTILDVAREAGVSRAAVSKVIRDAYGVSDEMRAKVEDAIQRLGYRPSVAARAIRGASRTIGFELHQIENPALARILSGAVDAMSETGYQLVVAPASKLDRTGHDALDALVDLQVDGLVAVAPQAEPKQLEALAARVPLVLLSRHTTSPNFDTITGDDEAGTRLALEHLFAAGHDRVAHFTIGTAATSRAGSPPAVRMTTYLETMRETGREDLAQIVHLDDSADIHAATARLLDGPTPPTAVFAAFDALALEILHVVRARDLSACDLAVVGYDNIRLASHPGISLSSVDQLGDELGRRAVRLLLERISGRTEAKHEMTTPRLFVRSSSSA